MDKKYEFTGETFEDCGVTYHRIRALRDFGKVRAGDLGGLIETEENLSQDGACWFDVQSRVNDNALVYGDAFVGGSIRITGNTEISGDIEVYGDGEIYGNTTIRGAYSGPSKLDVVGAIKDARIIFSDES